MSRATARTKRHAEEAGRAGPHPNPCPESSQVYRWRKGPRLQRNRFVRLGHGGGGAGASLRRHIVDGGGAPSGTNGPHGIVVETKNKSIWLFEGACRRLANVSSWGRSGPDPGAPFGRPGIRTSKTDGTKMCDAFDLFLGVRLRWHSAEWYKCHLLSSAGARRRLKQT